MKVNYKIGKDNEKYEISLERHEVQRNNIDMRRTA